MDITSPELQKFIRDHENDDERALVLKQKEILGIPSSLVAQQIAGRRKAKTKLPTYYNTEGIIYPPTINLEQCSSEHTAKFKAQILSSLFDAKEPIIGADISGGFGVDALFLSKLANEFHYCEPNNDLLIMARHNHRLLGGSNITHHNLSAEDFTRVFAENFYKERGRRFNFIYVDPSRRILTDSRQQNDWSQRTFSFSDSDPDILPLLPQLASRSDYILIKASPLLDITMAISQLSRVTNVFVVAVDNEVKELLFLIKSDSNLSEPVVNAINVQKSGVEELNFTFTEEKNSPAELSDPLTYLYEPNAAIIKAGAFKKAASNFNLKKLHGSTHLYTSHEVVGSFPGRIFKIDDFVKPDAKSIAAKVPEKKVNVIVRNYPLSTNELKSKLKVIDGGEKFLIAFTGPTKKFVTIATRLR